MQISKAARCLHSEQNEVKLKLFTLLSYFKNITFLENVIIETSRNNCESSNLS